MKSTIRSLILKTQTPPVAKWNFDATISKITKVPLLYMVVSMPFRKEPIRMETIRGCY